MKIILLLLMLNIYSHTVLGGEENTKYPPYPDVWGYVLPPVSDKDRVLGLKLIRQDSGDIFIQYYTPDWNWHHRKYFFSGYDERISRKYALAYYHKNIHEILEFGKGQLLLNDGSKINAFGQGSRCFWPFSERIVKSDLKGKTIKEIVVLYKENVKRVYKNDSKYCEQAKFGIAKSYLTSEKFKLHKLNDGTFLAFSNRNVIIRFNYDLETEFSHPRVLIVDKNEIDTVLNRLMKKSKTGDFKLQELYDEVEKLASNKKVKE